MTNPARNLYGRRQMAVIVISLLAGIGLHLFRQYHETGEIGRIEVWAAGATLVIGAIITVAAVRKGNREE